MQKSADPRAGDVDRNICEFAAAGGIAMRAVDQAIGGGHRQQAKRLLDGGNALFGVVAAAENVFKDSLRIGHAPRARIAFRDLPQHLDISNIGLGQPGLRRRHDRRPAPSFCIGQNCRVQFLALELLREVGRQLPLRILCAPRGDQFAQLVDLVSGE